MTNGEKFAKDYMNAYRGCREAGATYEQAHKTALEIAEVFKKLHQS